MTSTDEKIKTAHDRLILGRPDITDGQLTITNICLEAGVSRASFYRSAHAPEIRRALTNPDLPRPETEQLRQQIRQLQQTEKTLRSQHAADIRELRSTVKTYANQIQILALRVEQLEDDNHRLQLHLNKAGNNVTSLRARN
jgi:hypothetical protein